MLSESDARRVYLACGSTDLRKSIDGLAALVKEGFDLDPFSPCLFVFGHVLSSGVNCRCDSPRRDLWISLGRLMYPRLFRYVLRIRGTAER